MDEFGAGRPGRDGTQEPPPPRLFPDPLAGLVTGERYEREPVVPVVVPPPMPVPQPGPPYVPPTRRAPARGQARRSAQVTGQVTGQPSAQAFGQQFSGQPEAHAPHAGLSRREPRQEAVRAEPKRGKGGLVGCLVVLAALSGLLFNVLREIVEAVVDLLR